MNPKTLLSLLGAALLTLSPLGAFAQAWPTKPVKFVVPFAAGGTTDVVARLLAQKLTDVWGQSVVIENRTGAGGNIGADAVAKSTPDGYTLLFTSGAIVTAGQHLYKNLPFDPARDLVGITNVATGPQLIAVTPSLPVKDLRELIAYAKANPNKISFGSSGVGSATHLTCELLKQTAGIEMTHVPYKGTAPALAAELAGDLQVLGDVPSSLMPHVRAGKIRALAMFSLKRVAGAAEVPTIVEAGGPPVEGSTWVMFLAPAGTPKEIVNRISAETTKIVNDPALRARFEQLGIDAAGTTPAETAKYLQDEIAKWGKVIQVAGVKAEQ